MLTKIISGGQTGADRAALDVTIELNIRGDGKQVKRSMYYNGIEADNLR